MTMKTAKAEITPIRQRTQYSCMAASLSMALEAQGAKFEEDTINEVMGARPMQGATWEQAIGAAQHFGMRATLVSPCALSQLKEWTDRGIAVMIAWNPEGREWSHASCVFDVDDDWNVHVADPNIPDPDQTVRVVTREEFLKKWFEKWPRYLVRRCALAIEREITKDGRQVMASSKTSASKVADLFLASEDDRVDDEYEYEDVRLEYAPQSEVEYDSAHIANDTPKTLLGDMGSMRLYLVDGNYVRNHIDIDFVAGGNPARYAYCPAGELWVEELGGDADLAATAMHEFHEYILMGEQGESYETAHDKSSEVEKGFRLWLEEHPNLDLPTMLQIATKVAMANLD